MKAFESIKYRIRSYYFWVSMLKYVFWNNNTPYFLILPANGLIDVEFPLVSVRGC